jgi:hypothetical protein
MWLGGEEVRKTWSRRKIEHSEERQDRAKIKIKAVNLDLLTGVSQSSLNYPTLILRSPAHDNHPGFACLRPII